MLRAGNSMVKKTFVLYKKQTISLLIFLLAHQAINAMKVEAPQPLNWLQLINLPAGSLGESFEVVDEATAIVYATSLLSGKKRISLQKKQYCINIGQVHSTLIKLGELTYDELTKKNLQGTMTMRTYIEPFVRKRMDELGAFYGIPNIRITNSQTGEFIGFDSVKDLINYFKQQPQQTAALLTTNNTDKEHHG